MNERTITCLWESKRKVDWIFTVLSTQPISLRSPRRLSPENILHWPVNQRIVVGKGCKGRTDNCLVDRSDGISYGDTLSLSSEYIANRNGLFMKDFDALDEWSVIIVLSIGILRPHLDSFPHRFLHEVDPFIPLQLVFLFTYEHSKKSSACTSSPFCLVAFLQPSMLSKFRGYPSIKNLFCSSPLHYTNWCTHHISQLRHA